MNVRQLVALLAIADPDDIAVIDTRFAIPVLA
jgi:hypothetical protein